MFSVILIATGDIIVIGHSGAGRTNDGIRIKFQFKIFVENSISCTVKTTHTAMYDQKCYKNQGPSTIMLTRIELRIFKTDSITDKE